VFCTKKILQDNIK